MLIGSLEKQGLLDFQDALVGHPAYDLVSLLQDARRDVSAELEAQMFDRYVQKTGVNVDRFLADYARLGAQRNAKIVGIFVRLWRRDGKPRYLDLIPRVWALLERDLAHPALAPVAAWFDANIPAELRAAQGGRFAR
jgi:aminoglycoside/choline kinase family phosphotransferase